jgi:hypothetical protein
MKLIKNTKGTTCVAKIKGWCPPNLYFYYLSKIVNNKESFQKFPKRSLKNMVGNLLKFSKRSLKNMVGGF